MRGSRLRANKILIIRRVDPQKGKGLSAHRTRNLKLASTLFTLAILVVAAFLLSHSTNPSVNESSTFQARSPDVPASVGFAGPEVFSLGAASNSTVNIPNTGGSVHSNSIQFKINMKSSGFVRLFLYDRYNGSLLIPVGTNVGIQLGNWAFVLQEGTDPFSTPNPLISLQNGASICLVLVTVPAASQPGSYKFTLGILSYTDSNANQVNWGDYLPVNLNVQ